jgi:N-acetylglucosamine kinase-like BadF-type ATPase
MLFLHLLCEKQVKEMILIADSGSTKTHWCVVDKGQAVKSFVTAGMNPFFQTEKELILEFKQSLMPAIKGFRFSTAYFYGAGLVSKDNKIKVCLALTTLLQTSVEVNGDLMGAARALCLRRPGIACILGTGSNSCLYDGFMVVKNIPPLGYILGDEGSGAVLGKMLAGDCLKNRMPQYLADKFMSQYNLTAAELLDRVYRQPFPNRYLATLSRFLGENIDEPYVNNLLCDAFRSFFIRNVMQYDGFDTYKVNFIGSIAFFYQPQLRFAAQSLGINVGVVEQSPMPGLLVYHSQTIL